MPDSDIIIIGAGLAGLTTAIGLNKPCTILEAERQPGGMCRSVSTEHATFDFTGHLLHLRRDETRDLVEELLPDAFISIERKAGIFSAKTFLPYPFQANFHKLPKQAVKECLLGFAQAWKEHDPEVDYDSLDKWALATLGEGICKHFFFPYNEKLYCTPAKDMSADWVSWSVPQPDIEAVIDGALGSVQKGLGYNASFLYPKEGGIELLPNALAGRVENIEYDTRVESIDLEKKTLVTNNGEEVKWSQLVSTIPLPELLAMLQPQSHLFEEWRENLRAVDVVNYNFVLDTPPKWKWHWLYLPDPQFVCYRLGVTSNISPSLAADGMASVYTEVSVPHGEPRDVKKIRQQVVNDLEAVGLLRDGVNIVEEALVELDYAYVVHDQYRQHNLEEILSWLGIRGIISTGRWGAWTYGGMEDAMLQGLETARLINVKS